MCYLCDESPEGYETCQFCNCMVCYDVEHGDDVMKRACATEGGDLACVVCAERIRREVEEDLDPEYAVDEWWEEEHQRHGGDEEADRWPDEVQG